jgi:DNA-binding MarR family transcriptional regulator
MSIRVKNWSQFQHFKDRKPIWIKLYRELLDDIQWHELDAKSSKVLVMLWLLASEDHGNLPDIKTISFRLRMSESDVNACISKLSHYLDQDASNVISSGYQDDLLEKRREETDKKKKIVSERPENVSENVWHDFIALRNVKKAPVTVTVLEGITKEATKLNWSLERAMQEMCVQGWQGFKAKWVKESEPEQKDWWVNDRRLK